MRDEAENYEKSSKSVLDGHDLHDRVFAPCISHRTLYINNRTLGKKNQTCHFLCQLEVAGAIEVRFYSGLFFLPFEQLHKRLIIKMHFPSLAQAFLSFLLLL